MKEEPPCNDAPPTTSETTLRELVESVSVMMGVVELTQDGADVRHVYDSPATERFFGQRRGQTVGRTALEIGAPPEAVAEWVARYRECKQLGSPVRFEYPHRTDQGEAWLSTIVAPMAPAPSGAPRYSYVTGDVTERRLTQEGALRNAARWRFLARLSDALRTKREGAAIAQEACDLLAEELRLSRCTYASVEAERDLAVVRAEASRQPPSLLGEYRLSDYGAAVWEASAQGATVVVRDVGADPVTAGSEAAYASIGTHAFVHAPLLRGGERVAFLDAHSAEPRDWSLGETSLIEDAAARLWEAVQRSDAEEELARANARLAELASTDYLTGIGNVRAFHERLSEEWSLAARLGRGLSLALLDLDEFKTYNDAFGHPAGDEALRVVGRILGGQTRAYDVAARLGGEEFAVLMPSTTLDEARGVAERLRRAVEAGPWPLRPITASLGVASFAQARRAPEALVAAADRALYRAKKGGRNRVEAA